MPNWRSAAASGDLRHRQPGRRRRPAPPAPPAPPRARTRRPSRPRRPQRAQPGACSSLDVAPGWRRGRPPPTHASGRTPRRARTAARSSRSLATSPLGGAELTGTTVQPRPGGGGIEGGEPLRQQRADHAAQHVAGAGGGESGVTGGHDAERRPSGSATIVAAPLSSTTGRVAPRAARAASMRSGPGACPISRSNSPSCGVSTRRCGSMARSRRGPVDRRMAARRRRSTVGRSAEARSAADARQRLRAAPQARTDDDRTEATDLLDKLLPAVLGEIETHRLHGSPRLVGGPRGADPNQPRAGTAAPRPPRAPRPRSSQVTRR